jgi:hypothetical protein
MSRLDDELKIAFKRQEPSLDFTARVLERINQASAPKPTFRQRFAAFFEMPARRWAAVGLATAALLVAIGVMQYGGAHQQAAQVGEGIQAGIKSPSFPNTGMDVRKPDDVNQPLTAPNPTLVGTPRRQRPHRLTQQLVADKGKQEPRPSPEAEAAKERVLFALQIASNALNDAQKAIQEDSRQEKPEPLHNR